MLQMTEQQFDRYWPLLRAHIDLTGIDQIAASRPAPPAVSLADRRAVASALALNFLVDQVTQHGGSGAGDLARANSAAALYTNVAIFRMQQHSATPPKSAKAQTPAGKHPLALLERASTRN